MFKHVLKVTMAGVALAIIGLALLGRTLVWQLWESGRTAVQEKAARVVPPEIALDSAVERTKQDLAARVVAVRSAIDTNARHLETQLRLVRELEEGQRLVASDLRTLAPHVLKGEASTLRGRSISKEEAKAMASRLAAKRQDYEKRLAAHRELVDKLRQQQAQLQASLAATEDLVQQFAAKAKSVESKLALVRAAEGLEKMQVETAAASNSPVASSLDALNRTLDRRLAETQERLRLGDQLTAPDQYQQAVRDADLMAELTRLAPAAPAGSETGGSSQAQNAAVPRPATREPGPGQNRSASLQIRSPAERARVPRRCDVSGSASGLEEASVEVVVTPSGDIGYLQDGRGLVKNGVWRVPSCLFGRAGGQDRAQQFYVKALSRSADGTLVESPTITVTRE
jgi:phage shock protein A